LTSSKTSTASATSHLKIKERRILITAGGTGGHIFPGLAVARWLLDQGMQVQWVGTDYGLETKLVPNANIELHLLSMRGLRGKSVGHRLRLPWLIFKSIYGAVRLLRTFKPEAVLSLGGYASFPTGLAAKLCRIPLVVHEQNAAPGLTNRVLAPLAARVYSGFDNRLRSLASFIEVGNPVRVEFVALHAAREQLNQGATSSQLTELNRPLTLLLVGGSQGAQVLNKALPAALALLPKAQQHMLRVIHQCGEKNLAATQSYYQNQQQPDASIDADMDIEIAPFITDMVHAYAKADIIICRAGALTVAEVAAAGITAIFVPLGIAMDDHQTLNARSLVDQQAALLLPEHDCNGPNLARLIARLVENPHEREQLAQAAHKLAKIDATERIGAGLLALTAT